MTYEIKKSHKNVGNVCRNGVQTCWLRLLDGALSSNNLHGEVFANKAISRAISGNSLPKRHDGQSLSQDLKNAGSKQQIPKYLPIHI